MNTSVCIPNTKIILLFMICKKYFKYWKYSYLELVTKSHNYNSPSIQPNTISPECKHFNYLCLLQNSIIFSSHLFNPILISTTIQRRTVYILQICQVGFLSDTGIPILSTFSYMVFFTSY